MTQFFALLKLQLLSRYADLKPRNLKARMGEKRGKTIAAVVGYTVLIAYLVGLLAFLENALLSALIGMGIPDMLLTISITVAMLGTLILAFFFILSTLYFGRDAAFLCSLPVRTRTQLAAKMTQIWLSETGVAALFILPAGILYGIRLHPGALFYVRLILVWAGVAALPIAVVSFLSTLLIRLSALWKRREIVATVGGIALLIGYMFLCMNLGSIAGDHPEAFLTQFLTDHMSRIQSLTRFFPPAGWAARGLMGDWAQLLLFLASGAAALVFTVWALAKIYRPLSMLQSEAASSSGKKARGRASFSSSSAFKACCVREIKQIFRVPAYATNILPMAIMPVLMVGVMAFSMSRSLKENSETIETLFEAVGGGVIMAVMAALMCFMAGMNTALSSAVTREGKGHAMMTALPVSPRTVVLAKLAVGMGLSIMGCALATAVLAVLVPSCLVHALLAFAVTVLFSFTAGCIALANDVAHPKLDWLTETEAIKQKSSTLIGMLLGWALLGVLGVMSFFLLRAGFSLAGYAAVLIGVLLILAVPSYFHLLRTADKKYCEN